MHFSQSTRYLLSITSIFGSSIATITNGTKPQSFGVVLFRAFDLLDVYGSLEILQLLGTMHKIEVALISETMDTVLTEPMVAAMNPYNSSVYPKLPPTYSFETAPKDFDVLILPGGPGMRSPYLNKTLDYIYDTATSHVKHVITVCTGSGLAARAGIMNGRNATTNKTSWPNIIPFGPNTTWIGHARWVEDASTEPPIWSSSGVTAGMDLMFHFVETYFGAQNATSIATLIEYERHTDPNWDPFGRNDTAIPAAKM